MNKSLRDRLSRNVSIREYIGELSALVGRTVTPNEIGGTDEAVLKREAGQIFRSAPVTSTEISFEERKSRRFAEFIGRLESANPSPIYVWTPRTIICGLFTAKSIGSIHFDFNYSINAEGLIVFVSHDLRDRLLLDFGEDGNGLMLKLETQGPNWANVKY